MSRKNKSKPADSSAPTSENPGALPNEADQNVQDKQRQKEAAEMFAMFRRELGSSGQVSLHRSHPVTGQYKHAFIGTIPVDQFTYEQVTEVFGGGDFIARGRTASGTFNEERRFTIDHTIAPKNPRAGAAAKEPAAPAVDVAAVIRETREAAKQETSAVVELAKSMMGQRNDQGPVLEMLKFMFDAQTKAEQRHADALRKSEERFERMISEMNSKGEAPRSLRDQIEEAKELIDLIGGKGGGSEEGSWWRDLGRGAAEYLGPMLKEKFAGGGGPVIPGARAQPAIASPLTSPPASPEQIQTAAVSSENGAAAAQPNDEMNPLVAAALRQFRDAALSAAEEKADVYEFVTGVFRMARSYQGQIFELANSPEWFGRVFGNDPGAINHATYIGEIRNAVLERAFVEHAKKCAAQTIDPKVAAQSFLDWNNRDFDDYLLNLADDRENWDQAFEGSGIAAPGWLELLRAAVREQLAEAPAGAAKVVDLPVTPRAQGTQPASPKKTRAVK